MEDQIIFIKLSAEITKGLKVLWVIWTVQNQTFYSTTAKSKSKYVKSTIKTSQILRNLWQGLNLWVLKIVFA